MFNDLKSLGFIFSIKLSPNDKLRIGVILSPWNLARTKKFDKLKGDLAGWRPSEDLAEVEKDDAIFKAINKVVVSYAVGDASKTNDDHHSYGGGYTPLDAGGAGGRYTLTAEEVRRQEDTPFRLGRSSGVWYLRCLLVLITNTSMHFLCDNIVERMRWRWVVGVVDKELVS
ncbi:hypothetical protein HAX54_044925 [Datura stramonium]|uniref:Uncharacterized protein n=1 Tax=Datura stramonium TaxID=4076 RepID=A0ABS8SPP4_DATST|nr:hypothetical protein [Datura stramonium]